jgi:hypothetical protein
MDNIAGDALIQTKTNVDPNENAAVGYLLLRLEARGQRQRISHKLPLYSAMGYV